MENVNKQALEKWLAARLPGQDNLQIEPISGGQSNPTWFVNYGEYELVLRKKPGGKILPGAHAVEREFRVLRALEDTHTPVPKALWLENDSDVLGTSFYVMERLDGRVFSDSTLPDVPKEERREMYLDMARTLAGLHALRPDEIGLRDYGRPGNYFERQIGRWSKQYTESDGDNIPELDALVEWLPDNLPVDDGAVSIAHGDFRLGNMMFHPTEPKVIAVLDWELSTLGHPLADLGFCVMPWLTSPEEYGGMLGTNWRDGGIPGIEEFVAEYFSHAVPTPQLTSFHIVFAVFRFAVIFVGIADRARAGNASSKGAAELAPLAERFAKRALQVIEKDPLGLRQD